MESTELIKREILEEDIQIMRYTLAAIFDDVQHFSASSAQALAEAAKKLEVAQTEFSRDSILNR